MKKLIALMFCLALLGTAAQAQNAKAQVKKAPTSIEKSVDQQLEQAKRRVTLHLYHKGLPQDFIEGQAVIIGNDKEGNLVLLASRPLTTEINTADEGGAWEEDDEYYPPWIGKIMGDKKARAAQVKLQASSIGGGAPLYKIIMPAGSFQGFKMWTEQQAARFLK